MTDIKTDTKSEDAKLYLHLMKGFLMDAVKNENESKVFTLLRSNLNPNFVMQSKHFKHDYNDPLSFAINSENLTITRMLLLAGADINNPKVTTSSVNNAVDCCNIEILKLVLEEKGDPNILCEGTTPLMFAAQQDDFSRVHLLFKYGADITMKDTNGKIAYDYATASDIRELLKPKI